MDDFRTEGQKYLVPVDTVNTKKVRRKDRRSQEELALDEEHGTVDDDSAALCSSGPGEAAMTTFGASATGNSTSQPESSNERNYSRANLKSKGCSSAWSENQSISYVSVNSHKQHHSATDSTVAARSSNTIDQCYPPSKYDAQGYINQWNEDWDCESYLRRRKAISGYTSASLHSLWFTKQKCIAFAQSTFENAKRMALKRQGPWPRPPPKPQNVTSDCMTCGLTMRYPIDIESFRCTVCATINTLATLEEKTLEQEAKRQELLKSKKRAVNSEDAQLPTTKPLNATFLQHIIDDSIRTYLVAMFCTDHTTGTLACTDQLQPLESKEPPPYTVTAGSSNTIYDSKHESKYHFSAEPTLRKDLHHVSIAASKTLQSSKINAPGPNRKPLETERQRMYFEEDPVRILEPARDYIADCFKSVDNLNHSFLSQKEIESTAAHKRKSSAPALRNSKQPSEEKTSPEASICGIDYKVLLLGDIAENGSWWLGGQHNGKPQPTTTRRGSLQPPLPPPEKTPSIRFSEVRSWYTTMLKADTHWERIWAEVRSRPDCSQPTAAELGQAHQDTKKAAQYAINRLMKHTEALLTRVGGQITQPEELRFLLIILENPLLDPEFEEDDPESESMRNLPSDVESRIKPEPSPRYEGPVTGKHSRILKRIIGLMANCPSELHPHLVSWFSNYERSRYARIKDLISGFLTYRLIRQDKSVSDSGDSMDNLIPELRRGSNVGSLHASLRQGNAARRPLGSYCSDWQVKCAARMLAILFDANHPQLARHTLASSQAAWRPSLAKGVFLPISDFYVSMVDYIDLVADFEEFEKPGGKFSFCRYPFLMSVWAKTKVLDFDSKRQMKETARDAFFANLLRHRQASQNLTLDVRRDCLADDSLKAIAESIGSVSNESKKALRIKFRGEEGIDGGGLRKEWFLLLVREVFNPDLGLFEYDEDSQYCYFNPHTLDGGDQFFLVGVILGLAIYNSTIIDVPLPPFVFRKLASMSPNHLQNISLTQSRHQTSYTLGDLAQYRPGLARGLKQLLDFEGDVEQTFMRTFVIAVERYGSRYEVPLCRNGERIPVTNKNRREYVDLYIQFLLETSVSRQFEPFSRGFRRVCSGPAFGLFRPEEVELLVRGSDEPLDVNTLRGVAQYDEWGDPSPDDSVSQVKWFWDIFLEASPEDQRKLLLFITGSDRVPAAGASMMPLMLCCLGDDCDRLPVARTCFNRISLWRYATKDKMRRLLWLAVHESEGFGLQ